MAGLILLLVAPIVLVTAYPLMAHADGGKPHYYFFTRISHTTHCYNTQDEIMNVCAESVFPCLCAQGSWPSLRFYNLQVGTGLMAFNPWDPTAVTPQSFMAMWSPILEMPIIQQQVCFIEAVWILKVCILKSKTKGVVIASAIAVLWLLVKHDYGSPACFNIILNCFLMIGETWLCLIFN